ncbi:unnamed protein product [Linum tenue]|uniref:DNA replication complex GINS protein PSF1 C-terminal domain-containing protein n=1 Tax=Linum tenue TaxID=586396 RepID=A0AAV0QAH3_9ROSI|nr:unnamed protein product [Linum tenue]
MYARKAYELVKELAQCEKGHLQQFNEDLFNQVVDQCTQHFLELQALFRYNRTETIRSLSWKVGFELFELPEEIQEKLSLPEKNYFGKHSAALQTYMADVGIDLNVDMVPPKDPYIKVRVLDDMGEGILLSNKTANLARHSMHFLKRTDAEQYIARLIATEIVPPFLVKLLLYPGAIAKSLFHHNKRIPRFSNLLKLYDFTTLNKASTASAGLRHLEIVAGSYLSVAGAILGVLRPRRMSLFGALMIVWGFAREVFLMKPGGENDYKPGKAVQIYPQMFLVVVCAFLSIRKDVRWLLRSFKARRVGTKYL